MPKPSASTPSRRSAPDAKTPAAASVLDALRALRRELRLLERDAGDSVGLPPAQAQVVRALAGRPAASLAELAARVHSDPSSVSVMVQRLVEADLVTRTVASDDRRRTVLALTPAGRARLRRGPPTAEQRLADAVERLGDQRAAAFASELAALATTLRERSEP